jgi:hypothetical protein
LHRSWAEIVQLLFFCRTVEERKNGDPERTTASIAGDVETQFDWLVINHNLPLPGAKERRKTALG